MGWFGYGKYDGDETASTQMAMVERGYAKKNIPLANGELLDEAWEWNVGQEKLAPAVVDHVFSNWDKIWKRDIKSTHQESHDINVMMAADFFINHNVALPDGLRQKTIDSLRNLLDEHSADFDEPARRRRVLRNFLKKVTNWPEYAEVTQ